MSLQRLHFWTGITVVVLFLLTGLYMRWHFPDAYAAHETIRYLYRANHIYLLFAGLVNVGLGLYLDARPDTWRKTVQRIGSVLVLAAPVLLLAAFLHEPPQAVPERPLTAAGIFSAAIGMLCHFIAVFRRRA